MSRKTRIRCPLPAAGGFTHPSPVGDPLRGKVQKRKKEYGFVEGKKRFQLCFVRNFPRGRRELHVVCTFRKWMAPVSRRKTGASASTETVDVDLVADIHPAEAGHPTPAAGSDHHDTAEAAAPVAVTPVMAATHAAALATTGGSFGRDERGGADGGDGGNSENRLADHRSLLVLIGCVLTSCLGVGRTIRQVRQCADS
jgi:hypothetical protein